MLDWLVIGGGIHGTHLSLVLTTRGGVSPERLRVLDPEELPLANWRRHTSNTGMAYLRSPAVHHLGLDAEELRRFSRGPGRALASWTPPYQRPGVELFLAHCEYLLEHHGLDRLRLTGRLEELTRIPGGWRVEGPGGTLEARNVLLATGRDGGAALPDWARPLREQGAAVHHLLDPDLDLAGLPGDEDLLVVGGGVSATQAALARAARQPGRVTLLRRHPLEVHDFDSDPGWLGPKNMRRFLAEPDPRRRRAQVDGARHRGSVPGDVARQLRRALREASLRVREGEVEEVRSERGSLLVESEDTSFRVDRILLGTGFARVRPGGSWLGDLAQREGLPLAPCGTPLLGPDLSWAPGLHASGPLAELELGPSATNISGARTAGQRLLRALGRESGRRAA